MIKSLKMNFTVPKDVAEELKNQIGKSKRSAFVTEAVRTRLEELKQSQLCRDLKEGYQVRYEEDSQINAEWESATLENWE